MTRLLRFAVAGFVIGAAVASCGPVKPPCSASNCAFGCCDTSGVCQAGTQVDNCGRNGTSCAPCIAGQACELGACVNPNGPGGGNGSGGGGGTSTGGGGTATGGGGTSTGGGGTATGGGGTGGGVATCSASNCNGCCDNTGTCRGGNTSSDCGIHGATCIGCMQGFTCANNACQPFVCPTCKDANQVCQAGNQNSNCGNDGGTCAVCGNNQQCISGSCITNCGPSSCNGCCTTTGSCASGTLTSDCGANGGTCMTCLQTQTCTLGNCVGGTGGGGGGSSGDCALHTCTGCCDSNQVCQPGISNTQCGSSNMTCMDCTNDGFTGQCLMLVGNSYMCF